MEYNLDEMLLAMLGSQELVNKWWSSPNKAFDLLTPQQAFNSNPEWVVAYILKHSYG